MPSWQSYVLDPLLRVQVKRKIRKARDITAARAALGRPLPPLRGATYREGAVGGVAGEWVEAGGVPAGTLLYLHGGGYIACSPLTYRSLTGAFAIRGFRVFAPDYRLAPEHPFPAAVDDGLAVYRAMLETAGGAGNLCIAGDSAGGGLVLAVLLAAKAAGLAMPACALLFSPWTDLAITGPSVTSNFKRDSMLAGNLLPDGAAYYLNGADAKLPLASPLYGDLTGLPPLLIQVGDGEVLLDDSTRLAAAARSAGVTVEIKIWEKMPHVWQLFQSFLPEARVAMDEAVSFAKPRLATPLALAPAAL
jgi:acetyl esterase/lipase